MIKKTYSQPKEAVVRKWHIIDASGKILGRVATEVATYLIGKHKPTYTSHIDGGDYVVVINAAEVKLTREKAGKKTYYHHSLQPSGMKSVTFETLIQSDAPKIITHAVHSMVPKNRLRSDRMARLKVYSGSEHPHESQLGGNEAA